MNCRYCVLFVDSRGSERYSFMQDSQEVNKFLNDMKLDTYLSNDDFHKHDITDSLRSGFFTIIKISDQGIKISDQGPELKVVKKEVGWSVE